MSKRFLFAALAFFAAAATAQNKVQINVPAHWSASQEGDAVVYTPSNQPAGTAQVLLLAPKPLAGEFYGQFEAERAQLEQFWGLRTPAPVDPQRGTSREGPWAAYFASYDSDGGARYMSFLARALGGQFVMLVFVAVSADAFNALAPQATEMFKSARLASR